MYPAVRQQVFDVARQVGGEPSEHISEIDPGVMAVQPCRLHEAHDRSGALARKLAAREEPRLPVMRRFA